MARASCVHSRSPFKLCCIVDICVGKCAPWTVSVCSDDKQAGDARAATSSPRPDGALRSLPREPPSFRPLQPHSSRDPCSYPPALPSAHIPGVGRVGKGGAGGPKDGTGRCNRSQPSDKEKLHAEEVLERLCLSVYRHVYRHGPAAALSPSRYE